MTDQRAEIARVRKQKVLALAAQDVKPQDIARALNITASRVYQILRAAMGESVSASMPEAP